MAHEEGDADLAGELERILAESRTQYDALDVRDLFQEEFDETNVYLTIHSGAGGTESCDWAEMLLRMYLRWCEDFGFTTELLDSQPGDEAGLKNATVLVSGNFAYGYLKAESGVHRLVRKSPFDSANRRHTSFASVHVSPEVSDDVEVDINPADLRVDVYRSSGAGGQHVNKTSSAVRLTHLPTGIVVACQNERSQHQNKELAMKVLRSRIYDRMKAERKQELEAKSIEKTDIAWGNQIRSYVFEPYQLVKDHRTNIETGAVKAVMDGDLTGFIYGYLRAYRTPERKTSQARN
jgi:peptide chain release factor 2